VKEYVSQKRRNWRQNEVDEETKGADSRDKVKRNEWSYYYTGGNSCMHEYSSVYQHTKFEVGLASPISKICFGAKFKKWVT